MERRNYYRRAVDRDRRDRTPLTLDRPISGPEWSLFQETPWWVGFAAGRDEKKAGEKTTPPSVVVMKMVGSRRECAASRQQVHEEQDDRNDEEHVRDIGCNSGNARHTE